MTVTGVSMVKTETASNDTNSSQRERNPGMSVQKGFYNPGLSSDFDTDL